MVAALTDRGWLRFAHDAGLTKWAAQARRVARTAVTDPSLAHWHVCEGTWFVGVDALGSDAQGRVAGSGPLTGPAVDYLRAAPGGVPDLDRGQISVVYPGYPRPRTGESEAAFGYRLRRDAAHVDGLKPVGPARRRMLQERHQFLLGLPLTETGPGAAPLVVWDGSPEIMRAAFRAALADHDPDTWDTVDLTDPYVTARRLVFDTCERIPLHVRPGEAYLLHRMALHGVAPWAEGATAPPDGRAIAYFRPPMPGPVADWLAEP